MMPNENLRREIEKQENWRGFVQTIPFLKLPAGCEIKVIPPTVGAIVRFLIRRGSSEVSIYLDAFDRLGCVGSTYWEIFPDRHGDNLRFSFDETEKMMREIELSLRYQNNE